MIETLLLVIKAVRIVKRDVTLHEYILYFEGAIFLIVYTLDLFSTHHKGVHNQELTNDRGQERPMLCGAH